MENSSQSKGQFSGRRASAVDLRRTIDFTSRFFARGQETDGSPLTPANTKERSGAFNQIRCYKVRDKPFERE